MDQQVPFLPPIFPPFAALHLHSPFARAGPSGPVPRLDVAMNDATAVDVVHRQQHGHRQILAVFSALLGRN